VIQIKYFDDDRGSWGEQALLIANVTYEEKCALIKFISAIARNYAFNREANLHCFYNEPSSLYALVIISGFNDMRQAIKDFIDGYNLEDILIDENY